MSEPDHHLLIQQTIAQGLASHLSQDTPTHIRKLQGQLRSHGMPDLVLIPVRLPLDRLYEFMKTTVTQTLAHHTEAMLVIASWRDHQALLLCGGWHIEEDCDLLKLMLITPTENHLLLEEEWEGDRPMTVNHDIHLLRETLLEEAPSEELNLNLKLNVRCSRDLSNRLREIASRIDQNSTDPQSDFRAETENTRFWKVLERSGMRRTP